VDVALDGESALKQLRDHRYDLAVCDWKMPGMNGQQIYDRIRAAHPAMSERVIFMTGDVINDRAQTFLKQANKICLTKPFSLAEFEDALQQALPRN
jgi:CheY-like chemotaxis protein